jgi:hypothetical protein
MKLNPKDVKFKFLPKQNLESEPSDNEINEIPDSQGRYYPLSLMIPESCEKQSL